jgi:hypothetical protein
LSIQAAMDYKLNLPTFFPDNPVLAAEQMYQERSAHPQRRWSYWLYRLVFYAGLLLSLVLFGGLLAGSLTGRDPTPIFDLLNRPAYGIVLGFLVAALPLWQLGLLLKTLQLSANSVAREKEAQTWELLVLSGINARRIVRGKWWATVQQRWPAYARLGLLRLGAVTLTGYSSVRFSYWYADDSMHLPHPASILLGGVAVFALTVIGLGFTAACGVLGSTLSRRGTTGVLLGIANQIVLSLGPGLLAGLLLFVVLRGQVLYQSDLYSIILGTGVTLVDNGSILASSLMSVWSPISQAGLINSNAPASAIAAELLLVPVLSLLAYGLLTWLALRLAERRAVSQMALPVAKG